MDSMLELKAFSSARFSYQDQDPYFRLIYCPEESEEKLQCS